MKLKINQHIDNISKEFVEMLDFIFNNLELELEKYKAKKIIIN